MNLSLRHLRLVHAVAEEGTLTAAARRLYLTQSAMSHQLADLERRIGAQVFTRVGRRLVPTPVGLRLIEGAREILESIHALTDDLTGIVNGRAGRLRVTTMCYTAYTWLPAVLPRFRERHPAVEFEIVPDAAAHVTEALLRGAVDVALVTQPNAGPEFVALPLFEDDQVLILAPDHPYAQQPFVTAQELSELELYVYRNDHEIAVVERVLKPAGLQPRRIAEVRTTEGIVALVAAGMGGAVVTRWSVAPELRSGRLAAVRVTEFGLRRQWYAQTLPQTAALPYMRDFLDLLQRGPNWVFEQREHRKDLPFTGLRSPA